MSRFRPSRKVQSAFAGALIIGLGLVPNLFWRGYGFSGGVGFPMPYETFRDYGPPFVFHYPARLALDVLVILGMAVGGSLVVTRYAAARLRVARSWVFLAAAAPFAFCAYHSFFWTTRIQFLLPILICVWLFLRPGLMPWLLALFLYASMTLLTYPSIVLFSHRGVPEEAAEILIPGASWLAFLGVTLYLVHARPRRPQPAGATAGVDSRSRSLSRGRAGGAPQ